MVSILEGDNTDVNSKQLEEIVETNFKRIGKLVIEIYSKPDIKQRSSIRTIDCDGKGDYFYSKLDNKVHKAKSWMSYYYYNKDSEAHPHELVYKVVATSNKKKYPELKLLTVFDLVREENKLVNSKP